MKWLLHILEFAQLLTSARIFPLKFQLKDRTDQARGTWEEVYRSARRADRIKNELHERDEGELERTGQPLTIYEPYFGEGTWPFLHHTSLYRGIGLVGIFGYLSNKITSIFCFFLHFYSLFIEIMKTLIFCGTSFYSFKSSFHFHEM